MDSALTASLYLMKLCRKIAFYSPDLLLYRQALFLVNKRLCAHLPSTCLIGLIHTGDKQRVREQVDPRSQIDALVEKATVLGRSLDA